MKKLIAIFTVLLLLFTLNASDLITLSGFLSPLSSYSFSDTDSERIDAGYMSYESAIGLIGSAELIRNNLEPVSILSSGIFSMNIKDAASLGLIFSSLENAEPIVLEGDIVITPDLSEIESLKASVTVEYEDVMILYAIGARTEKAYIDGTVRLIADLGDETLATLTVETGELTVNGDDSLSNSSAGLGIFLDKEKVNDWMDIMGYDMNELRYLVSLMLMDSPELYMLGLDLSSPEAVMSSLESKEAGDILDAIAFVFVADSDGSLDPLRMISLSVIPVLYEDGKPVDIDLKSAMDSLLDLAYFLSEL